jgi:hypothetical protein
MLSWHLLEKHFLALKDYFGQANMVPSTPTSTVGIGYNPPV